MAHIHNQRARSQLIVVLNIERASSQTSEHWGLRWSYRSYSLPKAFQHTADVRMEF